MRHPTLLYIPAEPNDWGNLDSCRYLDLEPQDYRIFQSSIGWWVRDPDGRLVYFGAGPVRIEVSPAPF